MKERNFAFKRLLDRREVLEKECNALGAELSAIEQKIAELRGEEILNKKLLAVHTLIPKLEVGNLRLSGNLNNFKNISTSKMFHDVHSDGLAQIKFRGDIYVYEHDGDFTISGPISTMKSFIRNAGIKLDTRYLDLEMTDARKRLEEYEIIKTELSSMGKP
jgi:hypothetical protein